MPHAKKTLVVKRVLSKKETEESVRTQLTDICRRSIGVTLTARGWEVRKPELAIANDGTKQVAIVVLNLHRYGQRDRDFTGTTATQWETICRKMLRQCRTYGWEVNNPEDSSVEVTSIPAEAVATAVASGEISDFAGAGIINIPDNWGEHFSHIYDRHDQIAEIVASIQTAKDTDMKIRNHCMLYGPAGCGKSEVGITLEKMFGEDVVLKLDATNTTKAGAENLILERDIIPPILILEELEKCNEANLPWLLGIMDDRGEVIKTNARIGTVRRKAPMLVICTINNLKKFEEFQEGALVNRFNVPLYFPTPDEDLLRKILLREVAKIPGGRLEWIEPALRFGLDVEKTFHARRLKAIMTNARDSLLDGSYQEARMRMMKRLADDQAVLNEFGVSY